MPSAGGGLLASGLARWKAGEELLCFRVAEHVNQRILRCKSEEMSPHADCTGTEPTIVNIVSVVNHFLDVTDQKLPLGVEVCARLQAGVCAGAELANT
jgi:hypothetical protein